MTISAHVGDIDHLARTLAMVTLLLERCRDTSLSLMNESGLDIHESLGFLSRTGLIWNYGEGYVLTSRGASFLDALEVLSKHNEALEGSIRELKPCA